MLAKHKLAVTLCDRQQTTGGGVHKRGYDRGWIGHISTTKININKFMRET